MQVRLGDAIDLAGMLRAMVLKDKTMVD